MKTKITSLGEERINKDGIQGFVAEEIDVSKTAIHAIEKGTQRPSYKVLVKLENLFKLSQRELLATVNEENPFSHTN